jgi:hypothetical protein
MVIMLSALALIPSKAEALSGSEYKAGRIIDDALFFDGKSMTASQIQSFLNSKVPSCDTQGSQSIYDSDYGDTVTRKVYSQRRGVSTPFVCMKDYQSATSSIAPESGLCNGYTGRSSETAAQIIYNVSQSCGISPKVLLVMLQKEQSLVTDTWPWPVQYQKAMGAFCPDTAPCDPGYAGFFKQVYYGAHRFKVYQANPNSFNYKAGRNNYIQYNPNTACGGTQVYIENQATANLYIYTPYQPNAAALNNLYGTGDGCSAYGNRNFWRMFSDWFGSTYITGPYLAVSSDTSENKIWLMNGAQRYHVSSPDVLSAWNLTGRKVYTVDKAYLSTLTEMHPLTRLFQDGSTGKAYFVDKGKFYHIRDPDQVTLWNFNWADVAPFGNNYAPNTFMTYGGTLSYSFVPDNINAIFMVDGPQVHRYSGPTAYQVTGSPAMSLSASYYNAKFAANQGPLISSSVFTDGSTKLFMDGGGGYTITSTLSSLYPTGNTVTSETIRRIPKHAGAVTFFLQEPGTGKIYVVDGGQKRWITSPTVFSQLGSASRKVSTKNGTILLPEGPVINNTYLKDSSNNKYLINNGLVRKINSSYESQWQAYLPAANTVSNTFITSVQPLGTELTDNVNLNGKTALVKNSRAYVADNSSILALWGGSTSSNVVSTVFVNSMYTLSLSVYAKSSDLGDGRVFLKTSSGTLIHVRDPTIYANSLTPSKSMVILSPTDITTYAPPSPVFSGVKLGGKIYIFDGGKLRETELAHASDWSPAVISVDQNYLNLQLFGAKLGTRVISGSDGKIYYVQNGQKRWISSYTTYKNVYAPHGTASVAQSLINTLPTGPNIP